MMLLSDLAEVSASGSVGSLRKSIETFAHDLDFDRFGLTYVAPMGERSKRFRNVDNVPEGYMHLYSDVTRAETCPVMQHARVSSRPLFWGRDTYSQVGQAEAWEEQAPFGYGTGFIYAAHLADGKHVLVGIEREKELNAASVDLVEKFARFQLFSAHVIDVCVSLLGDESTSACECPLTKRERECLQWTIESKTAWEVGMILSIGERTVAQHLGSAIQKMGTLGKHAAALKALRLGWIKQGT